MNFPKLASAVERNKVSRKWKAISHKNAAETWVFAGKEYRSVKGAIGAQTTVWSSASDWFPQGDNSSWIAHISAHLGSEALKAIYSRLCLQRCLMANSLGRCSRCLPPEKRWGVFIGQNNKDKSLCRGKVRHASCPLEKIQSPWALGSSPVAQPTGCVCVRQQSLRALVGTVAGGLGAPMITHGPLSLLCVISCLHLTSDPGMLRLPAASMTLWQASFLIPKWGEISDFSEFLQFSTFPPLVVWEKKRAGATGSLVLFLAWWVLIIYLKDVKSLGKMMLMFYVFII